MTTAAGAGMAAAGPDLATAEAELYRHTAPG